MRRPFLSLIFLCLGLVACGARSTPPPQPPTSGDKISFGIYDISRSSPLSDLAESLSGTNSNTVALAPMSQEDSEQSAPNPISLAKTTAAAIDTAPSDRKIIRNAELNLEAENPEEIQQRITAIAESKGGFVVESQQSVSDMQATTRDIVLIAVRVPSDRFGEALDEIRKSGTRVVVETIKGQDVTEEFVDIEAQLRAKKALEEQFIAIMKRANSVEDALSVQSQLASVRGEIERIEGRKRFLENQSSLSTIRIRLQTPKVFAASSAGFGTRLTDAFGSGFDVAMNFVLGFATFIVAMLPAAVFIGLPLFLLIRYVLRRQGRPRSVIEIAQEEIQTT